MASARSAGFNAGYLRNEAKPPKGLDENDQEQWMLGWVLGRAMFRRHKAEKNAAVERCEAA